MLGLYSDRPAKADGEVASDHAGMACRCQGRDGSWRTTALKGPTQHRGRPLIESSDSPASLAAHAPRNGLPTVVGKTLGPYKIVEANIEKVLHRSAEAATWC